MKKSNGVFQPNWPGAIAVYVLIVVGILYFVLPKAQGNYALVIIAGAAFGLVTYGIYDFTNYAILAQWPLTITLIDWVWGMCLCAMTAAFAMWLKHWIAL